jgi:hypothetical protein
MIANEAQCYVDSLTVTAAYLHNLLVDYKDVWLDDYETPFETEIKFATMQEGRHPSHAPMPNVATSSSNVRARDEIIEKFFNA